MSEDDEYEQAKKLRELEIRRLQKCACRYPLARHHYRNATGHEPKCPVEQDWRSARSRTT